MNVTLENFQDFVPSKIYWRGVDYYESGAVTELADEGNGEWSAVVEGTEDYDVSVMIDSDGSLEWSCDCPYDGAMCKHVVATLLDMRRHGATAPLSDDEKDNEDDDEQPTEKVDALSQDIELERLLAVAEKADFTNFVREKSAKEPAFKKQIIDYLKGVYVSPQDDEATGYAALVADALNGCVKLRRSRYDSYEEVDWEDVTGEGNELLDQAQRLLAVGNAAAATTIAIELLFELNKLIEDEYVDEDSDLPDVCEGAVLLLQQAINEPSMTGDTLKELFVKVQDLETSALVDQFYCDLSELNHELTLKILTTDEIIKQADRIIASAKDYELPGAVLKKISLLLDLDRTDEIESTVQRYIYLPRVREWKLEQLMADKAYDQALVLVDYGLRLAQNKNDCYTWLKHKLNVLERFGDKRAQTDVARQLFVMGGDRMKHYHKLTELVPERQWKSFVSLLLKDAEMTLDGSENRTLASILVEEKDNDGLFEYLSKLKHSRLDNLIDYAKHLKDSHAPQMIELFREAIRSYAVINLGDSHYRKIVDGLTVMRNLPGGMAQSKALAAELVTTYRRRRNLVALISRLSF